ncbi:phage tail tape measure protein [Paraburkholderia sp.]|uniref:phage tail tape measure protein n=1 Tax=Paraburkholderia sp. TaxID=1926495 RepID=UPI003D6E26BE
MANLFELGVLLSLIDNASSPLRQFGSTLNQTSATGANAMQRLGAAMDRVSGRLTAMGGASLALGEEFKHLAEKPIEAFIEMDSAMNDLKVSTLDKTGQVGAGFEQLRQKVFEIDARLPMTTAQVAEVGTALKSAGVSMQQMLSGAYDAAANLSVVLKMPGDEAGLMVARLREAYGLAGSELPRMADLIQRARFAFGISPEELRYASAYSAPTLNMLGLTGLDNAQKLLAIQGMGAGWNFQGSSFGTNFSMFLTRLSKGPETIATAGRGARGIARNDLRRAGVKFDFFDKHGQLKSVEDMIAQLESARSRLKAVGGDRMVLDVFGGVFGVEAGRVAELLAQKGMAGYHDALRRMADQASMDQRTKQTMESFKNVWTTFSSNISNALGTMVEPAARWLEPMILRLGEAVALSREWLGHHQTFAKWTTLIVGGLGFALTIFGSLLLTAGLFAKVASGPIMLLGRIGGAGFSLMASGARGLGSALPVLVTGLRSVGIALLAIPGIGWITAAIAAVAFLVWRYWTPIKAFASGLWDGLKTGFAPAWAILRPALVQFGSAFMTVLRALRPLGMMTAAILSPLAPLFQPIVMAAQALWRWFVALLQPVNAGGNAARDFGLRVGTAIAGALQWVARLTAQILSLDTKFLHLGASIIDGLVNGIASRLSAARGAVTQLGENIKGWFAGTLGIHSPSRVFMGFGENIGQGTEIGILNRLAAVRGATGRLSSAAIDGALATARRSIPAGSADARANGSGVPQPGVVIHFSPTVHVSAGADTGNQVSTALRTSAAEFEKQMDRYLASRRRVGFGG